MRVLVVHAHPNPESFSAAILAATEAGLAEGEHEVEVSRLYDIGFAAAMSEAERRAYERPEPILDPLVRAQADLVDWADALVFVFPTWWFGLPAILKGWLERVLVPGVGFHLDPVTNRVRPGLRIKRLIGITTYGSSRNYVRLFTDPGRRTILRTVRLSCSRTCRSKWLALYGMDTNTASQRAGFLRRVHLEMANL